MKEIEVGDVFYLKGKPEKFYIVSNIEAHLSTDIFEKDMTIVTLNNNETGDEIVMSLSEFWYMFEQAPKEETVDKVVYMGGHLLNQAMVEYRDKQHSEVEGIIGVTPYSPHQDKSINDKSNAVQEGLAERILKNDFKAMQESDVFVFDILNEGLGTIAELGIVLGMKHQAKITIDKLDEAIENYGFLVENSEDELYEKSKSLLDKPVFCYCSDIRQGHGEPYNDPDRAEFSTNQFVYGMVLELTNGEGFISWEEVKERLKNI